MFKKLSVMLFVTLFFLNLSSAGLVVSNGTYDYNKIYGVPLSFTFTLTNTESFTFYNISMVNNNVVEMPSIPSLNPGQQVNVNALIRADTNNQTTLRIKGLYTATVGMSNITHIVNVDYTNGLSVCDMSFTKGDKVKWINQVADDIVLKNADTGNIVTTILRGENYTTIFDNPEVFRYYFLRRGFVFTNICTITSMSDTGLVNNPLLDGMLNIKVSIVYNPTSMNYVILERNYTINPFTQQDGVMSIVNVGNQTAREVTLSGEWFSFNANGFDLAPGQSKGIVYTMRPVITQTSQTNITYSKKITITGNFPTQEESFSVTIPYTVIGDDITNQSNYQGLIALIQSYCKNNPKESFCSTSPQLVYVGNGTNQDFNVTFNQDQVKSIFEYLFQQGDSQEVFNNFVKEKMGDMDTKLNTTDAKSSSTLEKVTSSESERQSNQNLMTFAIIFVMFLLMGSMIGVLIYVQKKYNIKKKIEQW